MGGFTDVSGQDLARLLAQAPLCWIVPHANPGAAILMPVVAECDNAGTPQSILGHLPKRSPAASVLANAPQASFLFLGPHAYVSPGTVGRDDWGPTWNFASARMEGEVLLDTALTRSAIDAIVRLMEGANGWTVDRMGERADQLIPRIIGFRASITSAHPRFKLGQDESSADHAKIRGQAGDSELGRWMDRFDRD